MNVSIVKIIAWVVALVIGGGVGYGAGRSGLESAIERELEVRAALICADKPDPSTKPFVRRPFNNSPSKEF